jgi:N-acetylglutamate synthase-like GNAT family acetyltransferase
MPSSVTRANPSQATQLTEIAHAAKAFWNYPEHWLLFWRERRDMTITASSVEDNPTFVASSSHELVGFYTLILQQDTAILENLFIKPDSSGKGIGKLLFQHAVEQAKQLGVRKLTLESDPNAKDFYEHMGMKQTGEKKSMLFETERVLPIMELEL